MNKKTIWTIAIIMGLSFLALLLLQLNYIEEMAEMKKEQFDESVNRALYQASRNMELNETLRFLEKDVNNNELKNIKYSSSQQKGDATKGERKAKTADTESSYSSFEMKLTTIQELFLQLNVECKKLYEIAMCIKRLYSKRLFTIYCILHQINH